MSILWRNRKDNPAFVKYTNSRVLCFWGMRLYKKSFPDFFLWCLNYLLLFTRFCSGGFFQGTAFLHKIIHPLLRGGRVCFELSLLLAVFSLAFFPTPATAGHWIFKQLPDSVKVFKEDLIAYSKTEIDKEVATLQKKLEKTPLDRKKYVKAEIKALTDAKGNLESVEIGTKLFESTKSGFDSVKKLATEWETNGYSSTPTSFIPEEVNLKKLKTYSNTALKGYDYYKKITGLNGKLKAIDTQGYSKATADLTKALTTMGTLMSEFGEKVPFIGAFLKGYGDLTVGFVDAIQKLNKTVVTNINQGCIGTGTRADSSNMNKAWDEQGLAGMTACRENGLANVYANLDKPSELYLWDPLTYREVGAGKKKKKKMGRWWFVHKVAPGLTLNGLEKRYKALFKKSGGTLKNPSAKQVLHEYAKAVELRLTAENIGVSPGGKLKVKASGIRLADGQEVKGLFFELSQTADGITTKVKCRSGEMIEWQVPSEKKAYILTSELQKESSAVWRAVNKGKLKYFVGTPSFVRLSLKPMVVILDENGVPDTDSFKLLTSVSNENGDYLDEGFLSLVTDPAYSGSFKPNDVFFGKSLSAGNIDLIWNPFSGEMKKGVIHFTANYEGFESQFRKIYLCPATAQKDLLVYETQPVFLKISKVKVEGERKWNISVSLKNGKGKLIPKGKLKFKADSGGFIVGSGMKKEVEIDSSEIGIVWQEPEVMDAPVKISIISSEVRSEDMALYPEKMEIFYLPEVIEIPTKILLTPKKEMSTDGTWNLTVQVVSAIDGKPIKAYPNQAMLYLKAAKGTFSSSGKGSELFNNAGKPHMLSWIEPSELKEAIHISAQFLACEGLKALYSESTASLYLPDYFLTATKISCEITAMDIEKNLWELKVIVNDSFEKDVAIGKLKIKTDVGTFTGGYTGLDWDLSTTASPIMQWQGNEGEIANVTIDYTGDGGGTTGENIKYDAAKLTVAVPPEQDLEAPVIVISGVSNNKEHMLETRARIIITDNLEAPLLIDAVLANDSGSQAIPFHVDKEKNRYSWSKAFTTAGNYTIDVKAIDAMKNEARKIVSFKITDRKKEAYKLHGSFKMSPEGRAVLRTYNAELKQESNNIRHSEKIAAHEESCSICSNGGRKLVDRRQYESFRVSQTQIGKDIEKELKKRVLKAAEAGKPLSQEEISELHIQMEESAPYFRGGCPPGWECGIKCPTLLAMYKSTGNNDNISKRSSRAKEKWSAYLKNLRKGQSALKDYVQNQLHVWNMEYIKLSENYPTRIEEAKKRSLEIENLDLKKYWKKMKAAGIDQEEGQIWDKYSAMFNKVQKGFSSAFNRKDYGSSSKQSDRRWGLLRALKRQVRSKGSREFSAAIPNFMAIEEYYIIVAEMDALQKNEEKQFYKKAKTVIEEIKEESELLSK